MKKWFKSFWDKHGERIVFLVCAIIMAVVFWFSADLKESGKTILIGTAMLLYNKARSPEKAEEKGGGNEAITVE